MKKFLAALVIIGLLSPSTTQNVKAQTEVFGSNATMFAVVDQIRNSVESIIISLEASVGNNLFQARQHLELLLDQVEIIARSSTEKFFAELNNSEQQFFVDVKRQLDALKDLERITMQDVNNTSIAISSAIVNLPFADNLPLVFSYSPLFVQSQGGQNKDVISIEVSGALLATGNPYLVVNRTKCERSEKIHTSLTFLCDKGTFVATDAIEILPGNLYVYQEPGFIDKLFFRDPKEYVYEISINVIPIVLAKATAHARTESSTVEQVYREREFGHRNAHCQGRVHMVFEFNAESEWRIATDTLDPSCSSSSRSSCNGLRNVQSRSFGYSCTIANNGSCGPFGSWRDGRGSCSGTISWMEFRPGEDVVEIIELEPVDIYWGIDQVIQLPEYTNIVRIAFDKADGSRRIASDSAFYDPWLRVNIDINNKHVIVMPKKSRRGYAINLEGTDSVTRPLQPLSNFHSPKQDVKLLFLNLANLQFQTQFHL